MVHQYLEEPMDTGKGEKHPSHSATVATRVFAYRTSFLSCHSEAFCAPMTARQGPDLRRSGRLRLQRSK